MQFGHCDTQLIINFVHIVVSRLMCDMGEVDVWLGVKDKSAQADGFIVEGDQRLDTDWSLRDWLNNSFPHSQNIDSVIIYIRRMMFDIHVT